MPTTYGDRLNLPAPDLDELPDGPAAFQAVINALNPQPAIDLQGLLSTRPVSTPSTPGVRGRLYTVIGDPDTSQNGIVWRDYGTGWLPIGASSGAVAWPGDITPPTITADQNDYNPAGLAGASTLRLASSAPVQITGLAGGTDGRLLIVHNVGTNPLTLQQEHGSSGATNRFATGASLPANASLLLRYDAVNSRWRCVARYGSTELAYTEITSNVTVTATSEGAANVIVNAPSLKLDGSTPIRLEFYAPGVHGTASTSNIWLFDSDGVDPAASLGLIGQAVHASSNADFFPFVAQRLLTPAAGVHQFSIRGSAAGTGGATINAGSGGTGQFVPAYVAITRR